MQFIQAFANVGAARAGSDLKPEQAGDSDGQADGGVSQDDFALALEELSKNILRPADEHDTPNLQDTPAKAEEHNGEQVADLLLEADNEATPKPPDEHVLFSQLDGAVAFAGKAAMDSAKVDVGDVTSARVAEKAEGQNLDLPINRFGANFSGQQDFAPTQMGATYSNQASFTGLPGAKDGHGSPLLIGDMPKPTGPSLQDASQASVQNTDRSLLSGFTQTSEAVAGLDALVRERLKGANGATAKTDGAISPKLTVAAPPITSGVEDAFQKKIATMDAEYQSRYSQPPVAEKADTAIVSQTNNTAAQPAFSIMPVEASPFSGVGQEAVVARDEFSAVSLVEAGQQTTKSFQLGRTYGDLPRQITMQLMDVVRMAPDKPVELQLHPEELGRVRLTFQSDASSLNVILQMERPETLELLRRHIELLAQDMREIGYEDVNFSFQQGENLSEDRHPQTDQASEMTGAQNEVLADAETTLLQLNVSQTDRMDIRL